MQIGKGLKCYFATPESFLRPIGSGAALGGKEGSELPKTNTCTILCR